jgi:catechol 2,3-dioxygenase-like lactoylglutathione lyase family enzyme
MQESTVIPQLGGLPVTYLHIGYLTDDVDRAMATWTALGATGLERIDTAVVSFAMGDLPGSDGSGLKIELSMPTTDDGMFREHLERNGPGLDHMGIYVPDFNQYFDAFSAAGCVLTLDMRKSAIGTTGDAAMHYGLEACFMDCSAIGFPSIEMFGP